MNNHTAQALKAGVPFPCSTEAMELIMHFESFYPFVYDDLVSSTAPGFKLSKGSKPKGIPTIGFGTIDPKVIDEHWDKPMSLLDATKHMAKHLRAKARLLDAKLAEKGIELNPNQYGALLSWAYNTGGYLGSKSKESSIWGHLQRGDNQAAMRVLLQWNKAGGSVLTGLTRRRLAEKDLFLTPGHMRVVWAYNKGLIHVAHAVPFYAKPREDLTGSRTINNAQAAQSGANIQAGASVGASLFAAIGLGSWGTTTGHIVALGLAATVLVSVFFCLRHRQRIRKVIAARMADNAQGLA